MDSKLTLKLDKNIIEKAKEYAKEHQISLSRLIESYLSSLLISSDKKEDKIEISPFVKSIFTGVELSNDVDVKEEYGNYLEEKYR